MKFFMLKFLFCSYIIDARIDVNTNSGLSTIDLEQYPELITEAPSTAPSKTNQTIEPMTNKIESVRLETEQNFPDGKITAKEYYHTLTPTGPLGSRLPKYSKMPITAEMNAIAEK